jgi:hypothetical protein
MPSAGSAGAGAGAEEGAWVWAVAFLVVEALAEAFLAGDAVFFAGTLAGVVFFVAAMPFGPPGV